AISGYANVPVINGTSGNDTLNFGNGPNDELVANPGTGDDFIGPHYGNLTIALAPGDGNDTIYSYVDGNQDPYNGKHTVLFTPGVSFADVSMSQVGGTYVISYGGSSLTFTNTWNNVTASKTIDYMKFADGSYYDFATATFHP
ncbi:MAG: hypothetical protein V4691_08820, partial [Pseudomonadota bacterium]